MNYELKKVKESQKEILFRYLQYALYDGSQYTDNEIDENGVFKYTWFNNYFTDADREAYFIYYENKIIGFTMINENLKFSSNGKSVAEFLIMPSYRRHHFGERVAMDIFNMHKGVWEVEPIENNPIAYKFWKNTISKYTNDNYELKNDKKMFLFRNN